MTDTTEIAVRDNEKPEITTGNSVGGFVPRNVDEGFRLAEGLVKGGGAPNGTTPMQAFTIIAKGMELGFGPLQSLSTIASINGRLSIYGDGLIALARRGKNRVEEKIEGNGDARKATCTITRSDTGEVIVRAFSVDDAKRARLWGKPGPWSQYPDRMLQMRARAYAIRDGLGDQLFGIHVAEDIQDLPPAKVVTEPGEVPASANRLQARLGTAPNETLEIEEAPAAIEDDGPVIDPDDPGPDPQQSFDDDWNEIEPNQAA